MQSAGLSVRSQRESYLRPGVRPRKLQVAGRGTSRQNNSRQYWGCRTRRKPHAPDPALSRCRWNVHPFFPNRRFIIVPRIRGIWEDTHPQTGGTGGTSIMVPLHSHLPTARFDLFPVHFQVDRSTSQISVNGRRTGDSHFNRVTISGQQVRIN